MNRDTVPMVTDRDPNFTHVLADVTTLPIRPASIPDSEHATVRLRPLRRGEHAAVLEVFAGLSLRSRSLRFLAPVPRIDGQMLAWMTDIDQHEHVAWVAQVGQRAVGLGNYVRMAHEPTAEVALAVADDHQGQGIGRLLLDALMVVAASSGITTLVFHTHYTNQPMRHLLASLGATGSYFGAVLELNARVTVPPNPRFDPSALRTLAGAARGAAAAA